MPDAQGARVWRWYLLAAAIVAGDIATKQLASKYLSYGEPVVVWSWLNLTLHHNSGAAFSFLSDAGGWQRPLFIGLASVISLLLCAWLTRLRRDQVLLASSLALVLGGALGNLWDRVTLGYVVDFISVHYRGWYFPAFNVADSAISVGACLLILDGLLHRDEPVAAKEER